MQPWELITIVRHMHGLASPECQWNEELVVLGVVPEPQPMPTIY